MRYEGSMLRNAREHAIRAFMDTEPNQVRVMLMSLKVRGPNMRAFFDSDTNSLPRLEESVW